MNRLVLIIALCSLMSACAPATANVGSIQTSAVKTALAGVQLPQAQAVQPTANVGPTPQPPPAAEAGFPEAAPLNLSGSGDSIQDVSAWPQIPGLLIAEGNASRQFFGIVPYDQAGNRLYSLVSTTDPYKGTTPFNFDGEYATRLEIKASDAWTIQIVPLTQARQLAVPGTIQGSGDDVIVLTGATADTAIVTGNSDSQFFGIVAYAAGANRIGSIVSTTDPYQGTVIVERTTAILEIKAVGDWSVAITAAQ